MLKYKIIIVGALVQIAALAVIQPISAETWKLQKGQEWKPLSDKSQDKYLQEVARIKKLVSTGQTEAVRLAFKKLKEDFPKIAGPDLEAFIGAEILFSEGKFAKAAENYEKFLNKFPESKLYEAALDRQFTIATAFLAGQKKPVLKVFKIKGYAEGTRMMEKIGDRAGNSPVGVQATVAVAESYEKRGKFDEAYQQWSQIASKWSTGVTGKQALLNMARCKHADYRGPKYDAANLVSAKTYYENFDSHYPADANRLAIDEKLKQIEEQRAYKQFSVGQYYQKTQNKQSADFYYQMVIDKWPNTKAATMAKAAMKSKKTGSEKDKKWKKKVMKKFEKLFL